jgi:hypothetical protein
LDGGSARKPGSRSRTERREVLSAVSGGLPIDDVGNGCEGLLAMKLFGPLPDILSSLWGGNVCVRFGDSGRCCVFWPGNPPL